MTRNSSEQLPSFKKHFTILSGDKELLKDQFMQQRLKENRMSGGFKLDVGGVRGSSRKLHGDQLSDEQYSINTNTPHRSGYLDTAGKDGVDE